MEQHNWKIQLDGLLKLIAGPLYKDREVFVRELVQNAHDSIRKRIHAEGDTFTPEIRWTADPTTGTLRIRDNGAGLTSGEIHAYLSTVGRSGTGELKHNLHSTAFIGQHGIGFLSAFAVADRVEVFTRSREEAGWHWISSGGNEYGLEAMAREERGTEVVLHLNREQRRFLSEQLLGSIVRRYADIIGLPVYVGHDFAPCNRVHAPWREADGANRDASYAALFRSRFGAEQPLVWWPVDLPFLYLDEEEQSPREGRVRGMLAVSDRSLPGFNTGAAVEVFISGMMVAPRAAEVLPAWASFVVGAIECDQLKPNAARDGLVAGDSLTSLRTALGVFLMDKLRQLGDEDPERLEDVLRWHAYEILGVSLQTGNDSFFEFVAPMMPLKTRGGMRITLGGLWEESGNRPVCLKYSTARPGDSPNAAAKSGSSAETVDASGAFVEEFLLQAARQWPSRLRLEAVDDRNATDDLIELTGPEYDWLAPALAALREAAGAIPVRAARMDDAAVPALLAAPGDAYAERDMQLLAEDVRMPAGLRRAVRNFANSRQEVRVLWINAGNSCIEALASANPGPQSRAAAGLLFQMAVLAASANLPPNELNQAYGQAARVIDLLLATGADRVKTSGNREGRHE